MVGKPEPALNSDWTPELEAAMPALKAMAAHHAIILGQGLAPLMALSRCAVAQATLPVFAMHRPDAKAVWFDGRADLDTPKQRQRAILVACPRPVRPVCGAPDLVAVSILRTSVSLERATLPLSSRL